MRESIRSFDFMVAAQARDHALETPARDDRELGGTASAMLVEQRDEAVRLAPKAVVNLSQNRAVGDGSCAMPRADAVRAVREPREPTRELVRKRRPSLHCAAAAHARRGVQRVGASPRVEAPEEDV
jgi:hypothetical protein